MPEEGIVPGGCCCLDDMFLNSAPIIISLHLNLNQILYLYNPKMKALLLLVISLATMQGMRRVVTSERLLTPLNEVHLLSATKVSYEDFTQCAKG
jgi:hypothetical protein